MINEERLKKYVLRKLKTDEDYLDNQINELDNKIALFSSCEIEFPKGEDKSVEILSYLIKLRDGIDKGKVSK